MFSKRSFPEDRPPRSATETGRLAYNLVPVLPVLIVGCALEATPGSPAHGELRRGGLRNDLTYPGDPGAVIHKRQREPCPIASPDVLDTDWIPEAAARGWLIVTRDSMIIQNRNEIAAIRENNAKMVALNQRDAQTKWVRVPKTASPGQMLCRKRRPGPHSAAGRPGLGPSGGGMIFGLWA